MARHTSNKSNIKFIMKRKIFLIASVALLTNAEAQYTTQKHPGDFTEIELSGLSKVNLYQSDSNYIVIQSKDSLVKNPHAYIRAGVLYITSGFKGDIYAKNITAIRATDISSLISEDTLRANTLTLTALDAGSINVLVTAKTVTIHSKDASSITLSGSTDILEAKASDASRIYGSGLKSRIVKALASDGSSERVWAINSIDATASDGSSIHVKGSPKEKNTSATDGGSVTMNDDDALVNAFNGIVQILAKDSGKRTPSTYGRHSIGSVLDKDSVWSKKNSRHSYSESFIGFGFVTGGNNAAPIKYGASREFVMGLGGGYKILKWDAIGWDIYYKSTGYYFTQNASKTFPDSLKHDAQKISLQNFGGLIYDRFIFTSGYHGQLSLDLGFYFDWTFNSREVTWDNNSSTKIINGGLSITNPTNYGVMARLVFVRGLSCYFNYRLSNVFNYTNAPTLPACVLGITFGLGD